MKNQFDGPTHTDAPFDPSTYHTGIEATCVWPMEFIKTQLQLQEKLAAGQKPKFTGMISGTFGCT